MFKLQKKPLALKRGHPTIQNMNFWIFFYFCGSFLPSWIRIRIPNPDTLTRLNPDPIRINPGFIIQTIVAVPDPHVFRPSGSRSGFINTRYGSGSGSRTGSFHHQAKVRKTLIPTVLRILFDFLSSKNDVNVPSKSNKQKNFVKKFDFCWRLKGKWRKNQVSDPNPDPLVRGMYPRIRIHTKLSLDPQRCSQGIRIRLDMQWGTSCLGAAAPWTAGWRPGRGRGGAR